MGFLDGIVKNIASGFMNSKASTPDYKKDPTLETRKSWSEALATARKNEEESLKKEDERSAEVSFSRLKELFSSKAA
jgi:hypothetical protein